MLSARHFASTLFALRSSQLSFRGGHTAPTGVVVKMNIPGQNKEND
jgi:hypothetical protein